MMRQYTNKHENMWATALLLTCSAFATAAQTPIPSEDHARSQAIEAPIHALSLHAQDLVTQGKLAEAAPIFEQVIANPGLYEWDRIFLADIYTRFGKPDDVIRVLNPVIFPKYSSGLEKTAGVRMLYVLALLDKHRWSDAVAIYEPTIRKNPKWNLRGAQPDHTFPQLHFEADFPEYAKLRAQAHLILGASQAIGFPTARQENEYMLGHLQQYLKYNPVSPDAHFVSGLLLTQLMRYNEAHHEFERAARYASEEAQPEIATAVKELTSLEDTQRAYEASKAAKVQKPTGASPQ